MKNYALPIFLILTSLGAWGVMLPSNVAHLGDVTITQWCALCGILGASIGNWYVPKPASSKDAL